MIFVTVGHQMPFDRLVATVDAWAGSRRRTDVFAQIGRTSLQPRHIRCVDRVTPSEFREKVRECRCIVSHAGMGTILTAMRFSRPAVVMPRLAANRETRNDHQLATARHLGCRPGIEVAMDEDGLVEALDRLESLGCEAPISGAASPELLAAVRAFVRGGNWTSEVSGGRPESSPKARGDAQGVVSLPSGP